MEQSVDLLFHFPESPLYTDDANGAIRDYEAPLS